MNIKYLLSGILLLYSIESHAGFLLGVIVGSALSDSDKRTTPSQVAISDSARVIMCSHVEKFGCNMYYQEAGPKFHYNYVMNWDEFIKYYAGKDAKVDQIVFYVVENRTSALVSYK